MKSFTLFTLLAVLITTFIFTSNVFAQEHQSQKNKSTIKLFQKNKKKKQTSKPVAQNVIPKTGSVYVPYNQAQIPTIDSNKKIVLFFRASWCPSCQTVHKDILATIAQDSNNVVIFDVNYDKSQELKKKYGVTYQHTFVQIDTKGNMIHKWSGGATLAEVTSNIK